MPVVGGGLVKTDPHRDRVGKTWYLNGSKKYVWGLCCSLD